MEPRLTDNHVTLSENGPPFCIPLDFLSVTTRTAFCIPEDQIKVMRRWTSILYSTRLPFCIHKNCILHSRRSDQPALHDALVYTSRKLFRTRHLLNSHARQRYPEYMRCRTLECRMRGIRKQNVAFILECICGWNTECRNYIECRMVPCTIARGNDGTIYSSGESNPG